MELNKEDGGNRKFILVQVPEETDEKSEAYKAGYKKISDICIERVKRAGEKVKKEIEEEKKEKNKQEGDLFKNEESAKEKTQRTGSPLGSVVRERQSKEETEGVDTGFKVFSLEKSHFKENLFSPDPEKSEEENIKAFERYMKRFDQTLLFEDDFEGLLYEIAIKDGFDLNFEFKQIKEFDKNKVYHLKDETGKEALLCLDEDLKKETVKKMIEFNKDKRFIYLAKAVDTTKKWTLKNAFGEKLLWEV
ncbi:MAG: hypothetical protein GF335_01905 [Candidatus Moranbacteria bacterium]|nr:hypothetical protein [Candidatus Moranbacteria bacterium]